MAGAGRPRRRPTYNALDYRDVHVTQVVVVGWVAAGCSMGHGNMLFLDPDGKSAYGVDPDLFGDIPLRRCDCVVDPDSSDSGKFISGGPLTASELVELLAEAADPSSPSARSDCATAATRLTAVCAGRTQPTLYVETDGCRRSLQQK